MTTKPRTLHETESTAHRIMRRVSELPSEPAGEDTITVSYETLQHILFDEIEEVAALLEAVPRLEDQENKDFSAALLPADPSAPPATTEALPNRVKRKCPTCGEPCAHEWCGKCERFLPEQDTP